MKNRYAKVGRFRVAAKAWTNRNGAYADVLSYDRTMSRWEVAATGHIAPHAPFKWLTDEETGWVEHGTIQDLGDFCVALARAYELAVEVAGVDPASVGLAAERGVTDELLCSHPSPGDIGAAVDKAIAENPEASDSELVGLVMRSFSGKANPAEVARAIKGATRRLR